MNSLYLDHFGLISPPFSITPDPGFFFEGRDRGVFISGLLHATLHAEGIVIVSGEVGSGKTLMSRILLARLPDFVDTVYLPNPSFSRDEIVDVIARDLGIAENEHSRVGRLEALQQELIKRHSEGRRVAVLIDEAHTMPIDSLEEVRRLSNLETDDHKLVQIILFGQPELNVLLEAPQLRQVNDRVVFRLTLKNLSRDDARAYLEHRLRVAGWRGGRMFTRFAESRLLDDADGRARRINLIADKALLAAFADQSHLVKLKHVKLAIRDVGTNTVMMTRYSGSNRTSMALLWLVSIAATAFLSFWYSTFRADEAKAVTVSPAPTATASLPVPVIEPASAPALTALIAEPTIPAQPAPELPASAAAATIEFAAATDSPASAVATTDAASVVIVQPAPTPRPLSFADHLRHDFDYALQQSANSSYSIQLATISTAEEASAFLSEAGATLTDGRVFLRRSPVGKQADYQQSRYVIYFGSFGSLASAKQGIGQLPDNYQKAQPIIRTWKEIIDAPWIR